jgi:Helix-turn-helix domain
MTSLTVDRYVIDVLMRDLVGHDRSAAAFIVYLWLWAGSHGAGKPRVGASLQTIATATGLSKSGVQAALRNLTRRELIRTTRAGPTTAPSYEVLRPWLR